MQLHVKQIVDLVDAEQRQIGQMRIERHEGDLILGKIVLGPAFPHVQQLFRDFEKAVEVQALGVIDQLDESIASVGLHWLLAVELQIHQAADSRSFGHDPIFEQLG